jgi:tripartite ATP-independent transporter DctP family solute receptor
MKMKKAAAFVLLILFAAAWAWAGGQSDAAPVSGAQSYAWNVAMTTSESTLNYTAMAKFKELVEQRNNAVKLTLYPNGQLGNDTEQVQGLIAGTNHFTTGMTSGHTSFVKEFGVFDLPNIFPSIEVMRKVLSDDTFINAMNTYSQPKNIRLLAMTDAGFRETSSNKSINSVRDIQGLKIRVIPNPYHIAYWKALNANPLAMEFTEVYMGLQQKTIDAQENPYMNIVGNKFYEVQDYIVETDHLGHILVFLMSNKLYDSIPADIQNLINGCMADSITYTKSVADESLQEYKKIVQDSGTKIVILNQAVKEEMKQMVSPVYDLVRKDLGNELVDLLLKSVQNASN